jgi:4-amino-4-deoxy-L-arabinose transferase-like glycosyltransferase
MGGSEPVESIPSERNPDARPGEWALLGGLSFIVFAAHMLVSGRYGYFVDELYYLACSHHLAWGFVDQPPLISAITWFELVTLGDSLPALHFLPAVAAGLRVLFTGLIARELGARRFGVVLACVCVMFAPIYLGLDSLLTMNVFESLFWMGTALIALKIFNGASPKLWLLFGVVCGVGLLNKHSMMFFGLGLFLGLLLTSQRKQLREPWLWLGALIALLIFLPNLLWQAHRDFPMIQLLRNVQRSGRNTELGR